MKNVLSYPELVISGGLLGVLCLIGYTNYSQMDTASDVALARANMAAVGVALEAYFIDFDTVPPCSSSGNPYEHISAPDEKILQALTTPIAYTSSSNMFDPFPKEFRRTATRAAVLSDPLLLQIPVIDPFPNAFYYQSWNNKKRFLSPVFVVPISDRNANQYFLHSAGPDRTYFDMGGSLTLDTPAEVGSCMNLFYDPTNGTISFGSLWHFSPRAPIPTINFEGGSGMHAAWLLTPESSSSASAKDWQEY